MCSSDLHLCLLNKEKIQKAEAYFVERGNVSTFIGRFIPGIRQLISIPAGLSRMPFGSFLWWTGLGAFCWNSILALVGYIANGQMELIKKYSHELSVAILILSVIIAIFFLLRTLWRKRKAKQPKGL